MRGAPHSGLSTLIRRISARRSGAIFGRPPRERDFQLQHDRALAASVQSVDEGAPGPRPQVGSST